MPFEPLNTDEKLSGPVRKEKSMDDVMLAGCSGFLIASLLCYGLAVWPFFVFANFLTWDRLLITAATGFFPSALVGLFCSRKFGLPGACGFVGGSMATSVFLHLNIKRILLSVALEPGMPPPFPPMMTYLLPAMWLLICIGLAILVLPKSEWPMFDDKDD